VCNLIILVGFFAAVFCAAGGFSLGGMSVLLSSSSCLVSFVVVDSILGFVATLPRVLWNKHDGCEDPLGSKSHPEHLLGALFFLKVYLKQSPGCLVVSASAGVVDPKTHHIWVWLFINAIAELVDSVVSNHNVKIARIVAFFVMTPCDSFGKTNVGKHYETQKNVVKKLPFFFHSHPNNPPRCRPLIHRLTLTVKKWGCSQ
jgi:hypothetical protein